MNVSDLTGALLDYWTGRAEGIPADQLRIQLVPRTTDLICVHSRRDRYAPSTNPAAGWPIIDRLGVRIGPYLGGWEASYCGWQAGATGLEAAMRTYVASVFGASVPDEVSTGDAPRVVLFIGDGLDTMLMRELAAAGLHLVGPNDQTSLITGELGRIDCGIHFIEALELAAPMPYQIDVLKSLNRRNDVASLKRQTRAREHRTRKAIPKGRR
ncbi:phage protein NinX family protein [Massilia sp. TSP1-1-2]|uniref:phage protein NinX family protein n=1 Tax=Massilia sp. TSP1-1-2 TaxID=2804649 RepID=UPI003CF556DA